MQYSAMAQDVKRSVSAQERSIAATGALHTGLLAQEDDTSAANEDQAPKTLEPVLMNPPISALEAKMSIRNKEIQREFVSTRVEAERSRAKRHFAGQARDLYLVSYDFFRQHDVAYAPVFQFAHHPIYFEDPNLERCGYSLGCCAQPFCSGLQFYTNVALCPFKMCLTCPCAYVYPQADCAPGFRYPWVNNVWGPGMPR
jgi:hypothetical protein